MMISRTTFVLNSKKGLLASLFTLCFFFSYGQTCTNKADKVKENNWAALPSIYDFGGSTFIACKTGVVHTISFKVTKESTAQPNAMLFIENGIADGVVESQTYADYVQDISIPGRGTVATIRLKEPFPVQEGATYTWYVQKDPDAGNLIQAGALSPGNTYTGGSTWYNNDYYPDMDNIFSVKIK